MDEKGNGKAKVEPNAAGSCGECTHFRYFGNEKGHNSPQALGKCRAESWDGNKGQWPMFKHLCKNFLRAEQQV